MNEWDRVCNHFVITTEGTNYLLLKEASISLGKHYYFRFRFVIKRELSVVAEHAVSMLLQFSTAYLCEQESSALGKIKIKTPERFSSVKQESWVCLSAIHPNIEQFSKSKPPIFPIKLEQYCN